MAKKQIHIGSSTVNKLYVGSTEIQKVYVGTNLVYENLASHVVTYHVSGGNVIEKEITEGDDCISNAPQATLSGYTFVGWRSDTTASSSVISSKTCDSDNIHLYAVFSKVLHLYTTANGTKSDKTGTQYYNNGNTANPTLSVANPSKSGTAFKGWSSSSTSTTITNTTLANGITISADTSRWAVFTYNTLTLTKTSPYIGPSGGTVPLGSIVADRFATVQFYVEGNAADFGTQTVQGYVGGHGFGNFRANIPNSPTYNLGNYYGSVQISFSGETYSRTVKATFGGKTVVG